jgi:hypothetical protein
MTRAQIENEVRYWTKEAAELEAAKTAKLRGASSASISSGGGSKSYTNYSIADFDKAIATAKRNARLWRVRLGGADPRLPQQVYIRRG